MPEISDQDFQELQRLRNEQVTVQLNGARASFLAEHPWVPRPLIDSYNGDPNAFGDFGKVLLDQFPQPQPPLPSQPVTVPQATPPAAVPPEPPPAQVQPPNPAAAAMQTNPQPAAVNPNPPPAAQPPSSPVPVPGSTAQVNQATAEEHQMQQIRDKVRQGRATVDEALKLSQYGFTNAMNQHGAKVNAAFGGQR